MTQLSKQLSEPLVAAELARRGIVAFKSGKSISFQVNYAKTGNNTIANVEKDYLILKQEVNFQGVIAKKEMTQWKKD